MIDLSWQTLAGIFLSLAFICPIGAGYLYGVIEERTNLIETPEDIDQ